MMSSGCLLLGEEDLGSLIDDLDYFFFHRKFIIFLNNKFNLILGFCISLNYLSC